MTLPADFRVQYLERIGLDSAGEWPPAAGTIEGFATCLTVGPGDDLGGKSLSRPVLPGDEPWAVADVVALEQRIAAEGTSLLTLMNRAGAALAQVVANCAAMICSDPAVVHEDGSFDPARVAVYSSEAPVVVLTGNGNNGGDGWVCAKLLHEQGVPVVLVAAKAAQDLKAEPARTAALEATEAGFSVIVLPDESQLQNLLSRACVVVDAILGTGFAPGQVREPFATWIELANAACAKKPLISADVPSAASVDADITVTMLRVKDAPYSGVVLLADLAE